MLLAGALIIFFFFNDTATTEIYTLSLHDALPIWRGDVRSARAERRGEDDAAVDPGADRKSTRLNSSHSQISYAVFCLKKKINTEMHTRADCTLLRPCRHVYDPRLCRSSRLLHRIA